MRHRTSSRLGYAVVLALSLASTVQGAHGAVLPRPETPASRAPIPEPRLVQVQLGNGVSSGTLVRAGFDVVDVHDDVVKLLAWPWDDSRLAALGAPVSVVDAHPGRTAAAAAEAELARRPSPRTSVRTQGATGTTAAPPYGSGSLGGFWTTTEIKAKLNDLVAGDTHDVVADKIDTVGYSREGRPIWGLEVGKHVTGTDTRPVVFYNSLTHAREPGGMQGLFWFIDDLLAKYGTDPFATYLLNNRRIYICPLVNPDGYKVNEDTYNNSMPHTFGLWRKNTRDNNNNNAFGADSDGVDLNRNYGYQWGLDNAGSSPFMTDETYRGPSAFSEIETQVQRNLVQTLKPKTGLSFHTYADLMLHAWGYTNSQPVDAAAFHEWNDLLTHDNAFQSGQSGPLLYSVNGEFNDWAYGDTISKPRAFTWTPEIGNDNDFFWPPPSRIVPLAQEVLRTSYMVAAIAGEFVQADGYTITEGSLRRSYGAHVSVRARNLGIAAAGPGLTGTLTPIDPGVRMLVSTISYPTLGMRTSGDPLGGATFEMVVDTAAVIGTLERFQIQFGDAAGLVSRDTISIPIGLPTVLATDDASNGTVQWAVSPAGTWGVVQNDPAHPSRYFNDSPAGNYGIGSAATMTLTPPLNLTSGTHAYAVYDARWDVQRDYDAGVVEASFNGSTWNNVRAPGSWPSSGLGVQIPTGRWFYEGTRWQWRTEWTDLTSYMGAAGSAVRLRFRLRSDGNTNFDGLSLDSLRILLFDPAAQPTLVAVGPASAAHTLELSALQPNPASRLARFEFALPVASPVSLDVVDIEGRVVRSLVSGVVTAGRYARQWDLADAGGRRVNAGVYFVRLATPSLRLTRRLVVIH